MTDGFVVLVEFDITPEHAADFLEHVRVNAAASVHDEPGCRRFDILQPEGGTGPITLYEIYHDRDAFAAHLGTPHFASFDAVTRNMIRGRVVRRFDLHENAK